MQSVADALRAVLARVSRLGAQDVPLDEAAGRVLAADLAAPRPLPGFDNSAMDGYAARAADLPAAGDSVFGVAGTGFAGAQFDGTVPAGRCLRIMTGAVMPAGLDTVVPQEFCRLEGERVIVPAGVVRTGDNRRLAGEDLARGARRRDAARPVAPGRARRARVRAGPSSRAGRASR
ncbi:MAG: hypothetical protein KIT31_10605 [Deltaproteobacteria bacterium]|nr:hypothetical protein [Deltaproteobacteria bacterium]